MKNPPRVPKLVDGIPVRCSDNPTEFNGEQWVTLVPKNAQDDRLWEFSLTTGRIVRTRP